MRISIKSVTFLAVGTILSMAIAGLVSSTNASAATCVSGVYRQGSKGTCVKYIQILVKYSKYPKTNIVADGAFGAKTTAAVKSYQKNMGLSVDGVVGKRTWSYICSPQQGSVGGGSGWGSKAAEKAARAAGCNTIVK